jgi:hypothetical protein
MAACVSIPLATAENDTLIVGQFNILRDMTRNKEVNGTFTGGIKLSFRSVNDNSISNCLTQEDGWFFLAVADEGIYELSELYYERAGGNTRYIFNPNLERCFVVKKGKVNNLGLITLSYEDRKTSLEDSTKYDTIKTAFSERFAELEWNNVEWVHTNLRLDMVNIDNNHFVKDVFADPNDTKRFDWPWIMWDNIANRQVKSYHPPLSDETALEWARKNLDLGLMTGTRIAWDIDSLNFTMREVPAIVQSDTRIISNYLLFNFISIDGNTYDTIMLAW